MEILAEYMNTETATLSALIWSIIFIANFVAKRTPNKTDNKVLDILRRVARAIGAEPSTKDIE